MFIPANFAIGALVGAAASYVYKDETAREALANIGSKVKGGVSSTLELLKKKPETEEAIVAEQDAAEIVAEEVEMTKEAKSDKA